MTPARRSEKIDPRCRVRHLSRFEKGRQHVRIWPPATPLHPHEPSPKQAHVSPGCCFGHAVSRMLTQSLLNVDAKGTDHGLWSEDSRGAITPQGPQILARPEDTKNDWLSQSLLRPLSIVFISRGICKHPWPMAACASLTSAVHTATNASCLPVTRRRNSRCAFPVFASSGQGWL